MAAAGFARTTASMKAWRFWSSASGANDRFPIGACTIPLLSTRNSIFPALSSLTALATSIVTVPALGFGIRPRGPSTLPSGPSWPITSGVATITSVSSQPSLIFCTYSTPTKSAPAASASFARSPCAITSTRMRFPVPFGRLTVPRTIWSACFGSTPNRTATSTDSSNVAYPVASTFSRASRGGYSLRGSSVATAARYFFPCPRISPPPRGPSTARCPRSSSSRRRDRWRSSPAA